ncbi:hypothetical protein D0T12_27880 [Actinomadura spongiicola]|uniref:Uncharacterized protein n=1 Tax=Actinomadura spongiicola TaxID=2303421 RepID=A0A372GAH3_9ACTN|nr:hypothetical protein [Actinomadura spongiicola]RFS82073.1 hypothetical protein D0T12_27880 [Actinomadura spongiicola]
MPDPSSPIARLRPARRRCAPRRFADRPKIQFIVLSSVPAGQRTRGRGHRTFAWTLYSRWQWSLATARAERERRRYRPPWE